MAVVFQNQGTLAADATPHADLTVTLPANQADDILLIMVMVRGTGDTASISGWTALGTADRGTSARYWLFWKRSSGSESNPLVDFSGTTGDAYAICANFRGAIVSEDPWEAMGTFGTGTANPATAPSITTLTDGSLVILAIAGEDNNNTVATTVTGTDPTDYNVRYVETATGADACFAISEANRATAGATGTVSCNWDVAVPVGWGRRLLALKPEPPPPPTPLNPGWNCSPAGGWF